MTDTPKRSRRHFDSTRKAEIVRRHLRGKELVSDLATEFDLQPSQIHAWVNLVLERAEHAFEKTSGAPRTEQVKDRKIEQLEAKVVQKNEIIAELMQEHVTLKKSLGNFDRSLGSPRHSRPDRGLHRLLDPAYGIAGQSPPNNGATRAPFQGPRPVAGSSGIARSRAAGLPQLILSGLGTNAINLRGRSRRFPGQEVLHQSLTPGG